LSLLYRGPKTQGNLYQAGKKEIPHYLRNYDIALLILAAKEYQPDFIHNTDGGFIAADKIYVPLRDTIFFSPGGLKETLNNAQIAANHAVAYILKGKNVLSTCQAGWNRSGIISGLTLKALTNCNGRKIVKHIKKRRGRNALSNPLFSHVISS